MTIAKFVSNPVGQRVNKKRAVRCEGKAIWIIDFYTQWSGQTVA
jgi:hypothetical protein